jgi:hypothetical protein
MMKRILIVIVAAVGGCGSSNHSISAAEFQRSCSADSDCVPVYEGTLGCCGGACPNSAINQMSQAAYESAMSSRTPTCTTVLPCPFFSSVTCKSGATCANGTCAFEQLGTDGG